MILNKTYEEAEAPTRSADPPKEATEAKRRLVCSLDYQVANDLVAVSGAGIDGVKVHKLTEMIEDGLN